MCVNEVGWADFMRRVYLRGRPRRCCCKYTHMHVWARVPSRLCVRGCVCVNEVGWADFMRQTLKPDRRAPTAAVVSLRTINHDYTFVRTTIMRACTCVCNEVGWAVFATSWRVCLCWRFRRERARVLCAVSVLCARLCMSACVRANVCQRMHPTLLKCQ